MATTILRIAYLPSFSKQFINDVINLDEASMEGEETVQVHIDTITDNLRLFDYDENDVALWNTLRNQKVEYIEINKNKKP